jgi:hypothetical protein
MDAYFDRFTLTITKKQALQGSHQGPCDNDIAELLKVPSIRRQLNKIPLDDIANELKGYGAWDETELQDHEQNRARLLWIACGNVREEMR